MKSSFIKFRTTIEFKPPGAISRALSKVFRKPDPDFDETYPRVAFWYLEIEPKYHVAVREIGFDENSQPIVFGPFNENRGLLIDSPVTFNVDEYEAITENEFEGHWQKLSAQYQQRRDNKAL